MPAVRELPVQDREWLAEGALRLIAPLIDSQQSLIGLVAMGEKRSELAYSEEDRAMIGAIAASAAVITDQRFLAKNAIDLRGSGSSAEMARTARLCSACNKVHEPGVAECSLCHGTLADAKVPYVLLGKFRFERIIGAGGMGVVYKAFDMSLHRPVAIKTLPKLSPEYAMYLRREARAIASVNHPNLAVIHGVESWQGQPMLVFEYLPGGNLADRIAAAPLSVTETLQLGMTLAGALERIHSVGILHRDIKPNNIAFQDRSTPKLLDFGLAHIMRDQGPNVWRGDAPSNAETLMGGFTDHATRSFSYLVGTPQYMSPEAFTGKETVGADLWAMCMVLYECLAGRNPMMRTTIANTLRCVRTGEVPDIREYVPTCPENIAEFLGNAFSKQESRRPRDARDLHIRLQQLESGIA